MKIRLIASFDYHTKVFLLVIAFLSSIDCFASVHHMVTQFRTPLSLGEILHQGLLDIQEDVEHMSKLPEGVSKIILTESFEKIEKLQNMYDLMNTKSGLNGIHANERDFLQGLIDRIDQMIQNLENGSSSSDDNAEFIKRNIDILHTFRESLEH